MRARSVAGDSGGRAAPGRVSCRAAARPRVPPRRTDPRRRSRRRTASPSATRTSNGLHAGHDDAVSGEGCQRCSNGRVAGRAGRGDAGRAGHRRLDLAPRPSPARRRCPQAAPGAGSGAWRPSRRMRTFVDQDGAPIAMARPARPCRRRDLHLHALSAAGVLPDDRNAVGGGAAGHAARVQALAGVRLLAVTHRSGARHAAGAEGARGERAARIRRSGGSRPATSGRSTPSAASSGWP